MAEFILAHRLRHHSPSWWENHGRVYGDKACDWSFSFFFPDVFIGLRLEARMGYIS